jgi:hypothetical protein
MTSNRRELLEAARLTAAGIAMSRGAKAERLTTA